MCSDSKLLSSSGFFSRVWLGYCYWIGHWGTRPLSVHSEFSCCNVFIFFQQIKNRHQGSIVLKHHCHSLSIVFIPIHLLELQKWIICQKYSVLLEHYQLSNLLFWQCYQKLSWASEGVFDSLKYVGIQSSNSSTRVAFEQDWDISEAT